MQPEPAPAGAARQVLARLTEFANHTDAAVRSQALQQLAAWDRNATAEPYLLAALRDPVLEVRESALAAIQQSDLKSDAVRTALWSLARDSAAEPILTEAAVAVLGRLPLSDEEYGALFAPQ